MSKTDILVLGTVNAPFKKMIDANDLALCLTDKSAATALMPHLSVFFGEVQLSLQQTFAKEHDIGKDQLLDVCGWMTQQTGEDYPLLKSA